MQSVLILDPNDGDSIRAVLAPEGFDCRIVESAADALIALEQIDVSLVILDHALPDVSGWVLLPKLDGRAAIVCSRADSVSDRVVSLKLGADDFIGKPFEPYEFLERVRVVLDRVYRKVEPIREVYRVGVLTVDLARVLVLVNEKPIGLTPTEFRLLTLMAAEPGYVITIGQFAQKIWGYHDDKIRHLVNVQMSRLRNKLVGAGLTNPRIVTVRSEGYQLAFDEEGAPTCRPSHT